MDLISVIIPVYNVEKYIERCLESVLRQTYSDLEIIVVDDGSMDRTGALADDFASRDGRILVVHQNNAGVSAARNNALARATGKYVGFLDGDDYAEPELFATLYDAVTSGEYELAVCGFRNVPDYVALGADASNDVPPQERGKRRDFTRGEVFERLRVNAIGGFVWNKLFLRSIIAEQGIEFDSRIKIAEDLIFVCRYNCFVNRAVYDATPLCNYVQRMESTVRRTELSIEILSTRELVNELQTEIFREHCPERLPLVAAAHAEYCLSLLAIAYKARGERELAAQYRRDGRRIFREVLTARIVPPSSKVKLFIKLYLPALHTVIRKGR